jgi:hypothetical protein
MRAQTIYAGFHATCGVLEIATAVLTHVIQRTIAKQTVEILWLIRLMTWKIFTFFVLKKLVVLHIFSSKNSLSTLYTFHLLFCRLHKSRNTLISQKDNSLEKI